MPYAPRAQDPLITEGIKSPFIVAILGPRRVGKSTFVDHYVQMHPQLTWARFTMDSLAERNRIEAGELQIMIEEQIERPIHTKEKIWITIDEVQKCPAALEQMKILYDQFKSTDTIKFILTGSAHLDLHKQSAETLAGRVQFFRLREFTLHEHAQAFNINTPLPETTLLDCCDQKTAPALVEEYVQKIRPFRPKLLNALSKQLIWGGLPEILALNTENERHQYLSAYIQTYLERDIRAIENITDLPLYQNILQIYAEITGSLRDDSKMLQALSCARNTLIKYTGIMQATLLLNQLQPFIYSTLKRLTKSPKIYLLNNGLISHLTGIDDLRTLTISGQIGHRFENWFLKELQVWLDRYPKKSDIYFWRLSTGVEVDFVVRRSQAILPFEVSYASRPDPKKMKNLRTFMHEQPQTRYGFYIYNGDFNFDEDRKIIFIPAWAIN